MAAAGRSRRPSPPRGRHDALSRQAPLGRRLFRRQPVHPAWLARPAGVAAYFDSSPKSNVLRPAFDSDMLQCIPEPFWPKIGLGMNVACMPFCSATERTT